MMNILETGYNLNSALMDNQNAIAEGFDKLTSALRRNACFSSTYQSLMPQLVNPNPANTVCIYDSTSGLFRCGGTGSWTVPAGATMAKFEIWGAGASSAGAACCGGSMFGASGAYGTIVLNVTPGDTYQLVAGSATTAITPSTGGTIEQGGKSYITGPGLHNFCALGGCSNLTRRLELQRAECGYPSCNRLMGTVYADPGGACVCGCVNYCFANSCETCGPVCSWADVQATFFGTPFGYSSLHACTCLDTNGYGIQAIGPMVTAASGSNSVTTVCICAQGNTCSGGSACSGSSAMCIPGAGGFASIVFGGGCVCGDFGKTGMAKVSWC